MNHSDSEMEDLLCPAQLEDEKSKNLSKLPRRIHVAKHSKTSSSQKLSLNQKQAEAFRERAKKKKDAKRLAREEERNYVEFRKMEILYKFRPKSTATSRNPDDNLNAEIEGEFLKLCINIISGSTMIAESFPRRRRGVSMGFGERKAYFLSIRPNPKYATWFGKKKQQVIKDDKPRILLPFKPMPEKSVVPQLEDDDDIDENQKAIVERKGNNERNPFIKGCPFWTVSTGEEEEMAEDDYPVDVDAIEKIVNGAQLKEPPYVKRKFDVYEEIEYFKKDDVLFNRELIFAYTVTSVLNMFLNDATKRENPPSVKIRSESQITEIKLPVTWGNVITVTTFDVEKREPKLKRIPHEEPLKDNRLLPGETQKMQM
ncbi:hypothetical protein DICVIV_06246 [Dictyocaulus viviparus]|uniref:Uncharacterized protein n=1 Tax=Dictyocaulus viviparus TaxID=29172 RepID=A0A0D8XV87_DICVI|nr:hypothetical protein DICVIV_06246 [Dictyocaulus viviparus]